MDNSISDVLGPMLNKLNPGRRKLLLREVAAYLRNSNQQRIKTQQEPDGTPFAPRKLATQYKNLKSKRGPMFSKLRLNKHLQLRVSDSEASIGFSGRTAFIARQHHEGLADTSNYQRIPTTKRQLLGITAEDEKNILEIIFNGLSLP